MRDFVVEPHRAVIGKREDKVLNMTAREADGCRKSSVDLVKEGPRKLKNSVVVIREKGQKSLQDWCGQKVLVMPWNINWKAMDLAYNAQPKNYEELLGMEGIGPATVKGLALISELIYGENPSWRDPVKYSYAFGGKDGVPFPVNRKGMDEATRYLRSAIENAKLDDKSRMDALKMLNDFATGSR